MLWKNKKWIFLIFLMLSQFSPLMWADETLYLEVIVNGRSTDRIAEFIHKENDWEISYADFLTLGLKINIPVKERVSLSELNVSKIDYDAELQRLFLTVPSSMLPMQYLSTNLPQRGDNPSRRDPGIFINYNLVAIKGDVDAGVSSLWHEMHFFDNNFFIVSNGMLQDKKNAQAGSGYTRFETYYQRDNEADLSGLTLGDVINATPSWGRSIRMGGIRFARDYELDPTLITYPLPEFYGESALPGSVDLIINNQLRWREPVTSGPFLIDVAPYISGAGVAQVVTTDAQGQQVRQAVNFYVTNELLAPKMFDYDITTGFRRKDFGLRSDSYANRPVISSSFRYGLTEKLTPQLLFQGGEGLALGGVGVTFLASSLGVFDMAASSSRFKDDEGEQGSISYNYNYKKVGLNASYLRRYGHYRDLGNIDESVLNTALSNTQMQLAVSFQDNKFGGFNVGYFRFTDALNNYNGLLTLSWNRYFNPDVNTFLNISHQLYGQHDNIINFTVSIPLGARGQGSISTQRNSTGEIQHQVQAMVNPPYAGGFGWGISADDSEQQNRYGIAEWRGKYADLSASIYHSGHQNQYTGSANGALIFMDNNIYASRYVTDAFALVDSTEKNVPVLFGNQYIGTTDSHGKLLVPDLSSNLENRLAIDPMMLPPNAAIDSIEQMVIPRRKGGVHVKFPIRFTQSALVIVTLSNKNPLPAGAVLTTRDGSKSFIVGWDGEVYFENLIEPVTLFWEDGECIVDIIPATDKSIPLPKLGPYICKSALETN